MYDALSIEARPGRLGQRDVMNEPMYWLLAGLALGIVIAVWRALGARRRRGLEPLEDDDLGGDGQDAAALESVAARDQRERLELEQAAQRETAERARIEQAQREHERHERERLERQRLEREHGEQERAQAEHAQRERADRERAERERAEHLRAEQSRLRQEAERERQLLAQADAERRAAAQAARLEAERQAAQRQAAERETAERRAREQAATERAAEMQRAAAQRAAAEGRAAAERAAAEREAAAREAARRVPPAAPPDVAIKAASDILVMVADDSKVARVKTGRLLAQHHYRVCYANDGNDAARQIESERPDLVITDNDMPGMDGFTLTRHIRANPGTAHIPVIMITAADDRHRAMADASGVSVLLGKPYEDAALIDSIRAAMGRGAQPLH